MQPWMILVSDKLKLAKASPLKEQVQMICNLNTTEVYEVAKYISAMDNYWFNMTETIETISSEATVPNDFLAGTNNLCEVEIPHFV